MNFVRIIQNNPINRYWLVSALEDLRVSFFVSDESENTFHHSVAHLHSLKILSYIYAASKFIKGWLWAQLRSRFIFLIIIFLGSDMKFLLYLLAMVWLDRFLVVVGAIVMCLCTWA